MSPGPFFSGQDLGRIVAQIPLDEVRAFAAKQRQALSQINPGPNSSTTNKPSGTGSHEVLPSITTDGPGAGMFTGVLTHPDVMGGTTGNVSDSMKVRFLSKEIMPKRIFHKASSADQQ